MHLRVTVLVGALGSLLALVGGAPAASTPGSASAPVALSTPTAAKVKIVMKDRSFKASRLKVPAGKVTFIVRNAGTMEHEFVVIKTNRAPGKLRMKGKQASEAGSKGEIEEFAPRLTKRLTLNLAPGKYVLLCNLPGHYKRGQFVRLVVTAGGSTVASPPQMTKVTVSMFEMGFKLSRTTVPHGTVTFDVKNDGKVVHDFSFGSRGGGTRLLQPGQSQMLTVTFSKPGKYVFICTVEGHQEAGMIGVLTVT